MSSGDKYLEMNGLFRTPASPMYPGTEQAFEAASRIFAGELARSRCTRQSRDSAAPYCVLVPSGICVRRLFLVGALTEVQGSPGDAMHARVADPTGTFELEVGWQDKGCGNALAALPIPSFAAVTGSCRLPPGRSDRPPVVVVEAIGAVDRAARDAWVKRTALATTERLRPLWQRGGQGLRLLIVKPSRRIGEAEFTMLVLRQLAHQAPVPPDIEGARHAFRAPLVSGGGVISSEHPSAART
jgi:RPA family protein